MDDLVLGYRNRLVAVTGSRGYLGSRLLQALDRAGARVVSFSRATADVRDRACWDAVVSAAPIIFHLAGNTSRVEAARDPEGSLASTVTPLQHLVAAARDSGLRPRVVFASTATVYGLTGSLPVGEDTAARPATIYDTHKLMAEQLVAAASAQGLIDGVSLRLANVYGPSPRASAALDRGVLNRVARQALFGEDLRVFGDGRYLRDYVYIDDVVRAFAASGIAPGMSGRSFNVASGHGVAVRDAFQLVAAAASRVTGREIGVSEIAWPVDTDPIERRSFTAAIDRIASACDWVPAVSMADGVERLIHHLAPAVRPRS
jgi:nucleoside-diphosphate-sugar epimerase